MGKNSKTEKRSIAATPESKIDPSLVSLFDSSFGAVQAPQKAARGIARQNGNDCPEGVAEPPSGDSDKGSTDLLVREEKKRKRKRPDDNEDIEDFHMKKLHDPRQVAGERRKRKATETETRNEGKIEEGSEGGGEEGDGDEDDEREDPPLMHEALMTPKEVGEKEASELEKSTRTVFLGNVPSIAVSSKSYKTLKAHFRTAGKIISIRFRSIAFSEQIPRKAAFVTHKFHEKQQTMNAYVVYSTPAEAREALKLNGSTVLDRHIRVDSVAHPAPHDSKRCVFIGNLDFEAQEENLWRHFAACGKVESVRVVRDPKTNVGKGFAYDPTSVEQALLLDGRMMANDRKLRVTRAKNLKRNQLKKKPERRPDPRTRPGNKSVYVPKVDPKRRDTLSRAHKLLGRAGAAQLKSQGQVFEGLRATAQTDPGIKKGGSGKKTGRARARAAARTAAWKQKSIKKKSP